MSLDESRTERLTRTLWEDYEIAYGKALRRKIREASHQEKETLGKDVLLRNLFLLRRIRDPGFGRYITARLKESRDALRIVERFATSTYTALSRVEEDELFFPATTPSMGKQPADVKTRAKPIMPFEGAEAMIRGLEEHRAETLEYLRSRADRALEKGDEDGLASVTRFLAEMQTGTFKADLLFESPQLYGGPNRGGEWHLNLLRYMTSNIRYSQLYFSGWSFKASIANNLVFEKADIAPHFIQVLQDIGFKVDLSGDGGLLEWGKYLNDAESIAVVTWFMALPLDDRVAVLNGFYDFRIGKDEVSRYLADFSDHAIVILAQNLFLHEFYEEAAEFYTYCMNRSQSRDNQRICCDGAATARRQLLEFQDALALYEREVQLIGEGDSEEARYSRAVAYKNASEMAYRLGERTKGDRYLKDVLSIVPSLPSQRQAAVYWNLASASRRAKNYDSELRYLVQAAELGLEETPGAKDAVQARLAIINSPRYCTPDGKCNDTLLSSLDLSGDVTNLRENADAAWSMFQFRRARTWLAKYDHHLGALSHDPNQGVALYLEGRLSEAKAILGESMHTDDSGLVGHAYGGLIEISNGDEDRGTTLLAELVTQGAKDDREGHYTSSLWDQVLRELVRIKGEAVTKRVVGNVVEFAATTDGKAWSLNFLANRYSALGFLDAALDCADRIVQLNISPKSNAAALLVKGEILMRWDRLDQASDALKASLAQTESYRARLALAVSSARALDYSKAIDHLRILLGEYPKDASVRELKSTYEQMAETVINFGLVQDHEIESQLRSAEVLALKPLGLDAFGTFDYSLGIVEYGKGAETMLHLRVGLPARDAVLASHSEGEVRRIRQLPKGPGSLSAPMKALLGEDHKSISLGGWSRLSEDAKEHAGNPVYETFLKSATGCLESGSLETISKACADIKKHRNPRAHTGVVAKSEMLAVRRDLVIAVNKIIREVYSRTNA